MSGLCRNRPAVMISMSTCSINRRSLATICIASTVIYRCFKTPRHSPFGFAPATAGKQDRLIAATGLSPPRRAIRVLYMIHV